MPRIVVPIVCGLAMSEHDVICERRGAAGVVVLDRAHALNALTLPMVRALTAALDAWEDDPKIKCVVVGSASARAFCAGGDIRDLYDLGRAGRTDEALQFWREEYPLDVRIERYSKPYVSLIDGIVMGGGVGLSLHGSHRIAGERYAFAMPEVGIGFFPDVGATYALPRLPGEFGTYLALTGSRVLQGRATACGLATHAVKSQSLALIRDALVEGVPVDEALAPHGIEGDAEELAAEPADGRAVIEACFSAATVSEILARLHAAATNGSTFAGRTAAAMAQKSPTSLAIALEQMRRGEALTFEEAMRLEFRIVSRIVEGHDFYEGVRALIVDKDQRPRWQPASIAAVSARDIAAYFEPLANELALPQGAGS